MKQEFKLLLNINEALDSRFEEIHWTEYNGIFIGSAELDDEKFKLFIEPSNFITSNNKYTFLNIAFAREIQGIFSQDLLKDTKNTTKVFGSVMNGIGDKIKELDKKYKIDAVVALVKEGEEKRLSLYRRLMSNPLSFLKGWKLELEIKFSNGHAIIGTKHKLSKEVMSDLVTELNLHGKTII